MWLGGQAPKALARVGRLADGWLPGGITLDDAVAGRTVVEAAAADAGRSISDEHFGINLSYGLEGAPPVPPPRPASSATPATSSPRRSTPCPSSSAAGSTPGSPSWSCGRPRRRPTGPPSSPARRRRVHLQT